MNPQTLRPASARTPNRVPGLVAWYEAMPHERVLFTDTAGTTQAADGQDVAHWRDRGPGGRHLTEPTNKPAFVAGAPNRLDFVPAGSDRLQAATAADWSFLHDGSGCTVFAVYQFTDETDGCLFDTGGLSGVRGACLLAEDASTIEGRLRLIVRGNSSSILSLGSSPTSAHNLLPTGVPHVVCVDVQGTAARIFGNDVWLNAGTSGTPQAGAPTAALRIGLSHSGPSHPLSGSIMALLFYNRRLSDVERRYVFRYLGARYSIATGRVACLGDSITEGGHVATSYPARVGQLLGPQWKVTNKGASGNQADAIRNQQWANSAGEDRRASYVAVMGGINDWVATARSGNDIFFGTNRLKTLYDEVLSRPGNHLIAMTVLPAKGYSGTFAWSDAGPGSMQYELETVLNNLIRDYVATDSTGRAHLVDTYQLLGDPAEPRQMPAEYAYDALHPNQAGLDVMAEAVAARLQAIGSTWQT